MYTVLLTSRLLRFSLSKYPADEEKGRRYLDERLAEVGVLLNSGRCK
jgi:hypothetical protein